VALSWAQLSYWSMPATGSSSAKVGMMAAIRFASRGVRYCPTSPCARRESN
jgi:hypothetical protein